MWHDIVMTSSQAPEPLDGEVPAWLTSQADQLSAHQAADQGQTSREVLGWLAETVLDGSYEPPPEAFQD